MERGANVGISIKAVKHFNYINKNIVPRKLGGSQLLLIRVNNINNSGYSIGYNYKKACVFSSAVSALKCTKVGSRASVPTLDEVKKFLKERGCNEFEENME